jgi:hypothetical protein
MLAPLVAASSSVAAVPHWTSCHGYPDKLAVHGLSCTVAHESSSDFETSSASYDIALGGAKTGSTRFVRWSHWGDFFSYSDYGIRWSCTDLPYPYATITCTAPHGQAMRYHNNDQGPTGECSGSQPPYDTAWSGNGPLPDAGPYYTRNVTCSLAKALEYIDGTSRAGGNTPAYAQNMFDFPQGVHYVMSVAKETWACGVWTQSGRGTLTYGDATYPAYDYHWDCLSTSVSRLGQEVLWTVSEPYCTASGNYIQQPPPPPICKP